MALLGGLFVGTFAVVGVTLLRGHGALLLDVAQRRLGLGVTRHGDTWWLPLDQVLGLAVVPLAAAGAATIERWLLVLGLAGRPEVVLAESDDRGAILGIRETLAARLSILELPEDRRGVAPALESREFLLAGFGIFHLTRFASLLEQLALFVGETGKILLSFFEPFHEAGKLLFLAVLKRINHLFQRAGDLGLLS